MQADRARPKRPIALLALAVAAAAGCGGESAGRADIVIDTVAGVETVINLAEQGSGPPAAFRLAETPVRIGRVEGDGPDVFGEVAALAVAEDRTIYVADGVALEIRVFGADGSFRFAFGGKGEGPGEFEHIDGLVIEPDGTLAVRDSRLARVSRFSPEGEFEDSFRLERPFFIFSDGTTFWSDTAGRLYDRILLDSSLETGDRYGLLLYGSGPGPDTLEVLEHHPERVSVTQGDRTVLSMTVPFTAAALVAVSPSGRIAAGVGDAYRFVLTAPSGDTLGAFERRIQPVPVASAEQAGEVERLRARAREMAPAGRLDEVTFPATKPLVSQLRADALGRWWAGRYRGERDPNDPTARFPVIWDVFDPSGRFLGPVEVPPIHVHEIGRDFVAGVAYDALGVSYVVVYDLLPGDG